MRPLRPLRHALVQLQASGGRQQLQRSQALLARRAFSDATASRQNMDAPLNGLAHASSAEQKQQPASLGSVAAALQNPVDLLNLEEADRELHDIDFTAQRIGFPSCDDNGDDGSDEIREESREEATAKAERILAIMRHSMTELDIGKVIHRVAQYATLPRVTSLSRKQFLRSLEGRFGSAHAKEYQFLLAFLQGRDEVIDQLKIDSLKAVDSTQAFGHEPTELNGHASPSDSDLLVPEIMGLHPDLVADPKFIGIVFCYCRLACLNSLKLVQRPTHGQHRGSKSSLWQVKNDFRKVLDMEGFGHYAEMMGLDKQPPTAPGAAFQADPVDAEWEEFNLENDRIDFRMLTAQTQELIEFMKLELSNETISKMLIAMLASVKTSKLHRKIFQEMVCNIQTVFPEQFHEPVLSQLVPFLSGNNATYADFSSELATNALQHHQLRHEAILRALLESRMRVGHILIHDIDDVDPMQSISTKLSPEQREKVVTTAWNIVSVLDDRQYHMFFSRFLKYKLAWRPNRTTFGQTFLDDARKTLGPRCADEIMTLFEETFHHLSVETLTICRVKLRHARKVLRERATLTSVDTQGEQRLSSRWQPNRCVFYRNLPHGTTEKHLRDALEHIGGVERFFFFTKPVDGAPDALDPSAQLDDDEDVLELDELDGEALDNGGSDSESESPKRKKALTRETRTPKKKTHVIASDLKTGYHAVVEYDSEHAANRALQRALQIFGVMMGGWKEYRPVFSSNAQERTSISIQNIPFGTRVGDLYQEINDELARSGLQLQVLHSVPKGVLVTNGRLELQFASFAEAAQVVEVLHAYVSRMKSRRPPTGEDVHLASARAKRKVKQTKEDNSAKRIAQRSATALRKSELLDVDMGGDSHSEELEDEFDGVDEDEEDDAVLSNARDPNVDEDEEEYFAADLLTLSQLTADERALREVPRPFDVTWNLPPKPRNKHLYV